MSDDLKIALIIVAVAIVAICTAMMKKAPVMPDDYDYESPKTPEDNG